MSKKRMDKKTSNEKIDNEMSDEPQQQITVDEPALTVHRVLYDQYKHILLDKNDKWVVNCPKTDFFKEGKYKIITSAMCMEYYQDSHFFTIKGLDEDAKNSFVAIKIPLNKKDVFLCKIQ